MTEPESTAAAERHSSTGLVLAGAALAWLAAMLWSARATITGRADAEMEVTSTAYAMPGAVSAAVVAGAATGLAVLALIARRRALGSGSRFAVATGSGLAVGVLAALVIVTINTEGWVYAVVGGTLAAAATIGGAVAGLRIPRVIAAIGWASVTVFVIGFVLSYFQDPVLRALGSGSSQASQADATQWFSYAQGLLSGLAAAFMAYSVMRHAARRSGADVAWPWYALAGGGAGLLMFVGEVLTRTAGSRVLTLAGQVSELELVVQRMLSGARFNSAMIVLFVGAIAAVIAVGRTLGPARDDDDETADEEAADSPSESEAPAPRN